MKRILILLSSVMVLTLLACVCGCSGNKAGDSTTGDTTTGDTTTGGTTTDNTTTGDTTTGDTTTGDTTTGDTTTDNTLPPENEDVTGFKKLIVNCLGDSITEGLLHTGSKMQNPYPSLLKKYLDCAKVNNYGMGGTKITNENSSSFVERAKNMDKEANIIIVMGGTNDALFASPLGTPSDTSDATLYGALDALCNYLKTNHPDAHIIFCTPLQMADRHDRWCYQNSGYKITDVATAMKTVCARYDIDVYDAQTLIPFKAQANTDDSTGAADGVHPSQAFMDNFAKTLAEYIVETYGK